MEDTTQYPRPQSVTASVGVIVAMALVGAGTIALTSSSTAAYVGAGLGLLLYGTLAFLIFARENWARLTYLALSFVSVCVAAGLLIAAVLADADEHTLIRIVGPLLFIVGYFVSVSGLTTAEASRHFTGEAGAFLDYLVNRVALQTLLVFGIVTFGFFLADRFVFRLDLTEDERFSISEASHELAASLEDPLTIRAYFSEKIPDSVVPLQRQVFDILDEYQAHSRGKIKVERYDPLESTTAQSEASSYGVQPIELRVYGAVEASAIKVYGGIVLIYGDKASEVINIAARYPQGYEGLSVLEYEISSKMWELTHEKPKLGLTGNLSRQGRPQNPFAGGMPQERPEFTGLRRVLGDAFEIETVDLDTEEPDPKKMPLLLVVRPKEMSEVAVFRLDQYLMTGGRVLMFITEGYIEQGQWGGGRFQFQPFKTGLDEWLEHNGLRIPCEFVCHLVNANPIPVTRIVDIGMGPMKVQQPEHCWFWPIFGAEIEGTFDKDNPAVQNLDVVQLWWPHPIDTLENKLGGKAASVLLRSHKQESWRWKDNRRIDYRDLDRKADGPTASDLMSSPVAVALEGTFTSFFANRPVPPSLTKSSEGKDGGENPGEGGDEKKESEGKDGEKEAKTPDVVKESVEPTQLVVVGNSFFISDIFLRDGGDRARQAAQLAFNLVDWLARSRELIALRAKQYADRRIVDKEFQEEADAAQEALQAAEIDSAAFAERLELAREEQKSKRKFARWLNVLAPCVLILFAGAIVWIVRAGIRSAPTRVPAPRPPSSVGE